MRRLAIAIAVSLVLTTAAPAAEQPVELRGAWAHATHWKTKADADRMLDRAEAMHLNAVYLLVYYWGGHAAYRTDMAPLLGGVPDGFDPLGYAVAEAHRRGIRMHAWFVNGSYHTRGDKGILDERPEWRAVHLSGRRAPWFDLCQPAVRQWQADLMLDCLRRYPLDGLHFDYIRFSSKTVCACPACRERVKKDTGFDIASIRYPELPALGTASGNPLVEPTTARVLARFENGDPAVAVNDLGKGRVVLLNWHVHRWCPMAVGTGLKRLLAERGLRAGDRVFALASEGMGDRRESYFAVGRDLMQGWGYEVDKATDADLPDLPAGAAVVMHGIYDMPDQVARYLLAHVEAGGAAVFSDGPVRAVNRHASARRLLGLERSGRYFSGWKEMHPTDPPSPYLPVADRQLDLAAEKAKWAVWDRWRMDQVTDLVRRVSEGAADVRPEAVVTAAVFRTPEHAAHVLQDWPRWHRERLCDYVIPMAYEATLEPFEEHFPAWRQVTPTLDRIVPGIGAYRIAPEKTGEARAAEIGKQIEACRRRGARGVVLFVLNAIDDATAEALGRTAFPGKTAPYAPGHDE
jgi:uncharacterized lipoprotein YddW (UPF0748 family)